MAVAIIGSGDIAHYLVEEFLQDGKLGVHIISRTQRPWFERYLPQIQCHAVDVYSEDAVLNILDGFVITTLISTLNPSNPSAWLSLHCALLVSCRKSSACKRLIPSDFVGDVENFPDLPRGHGTPREDFRQLLSDQTDVEWTSVNQGWLMDYFVHFPTANKSYITPFATWPIDLEKGTYTVLGSGTETITWTAARDVAKAVVQLAHRPNWDRYTYVFGETGAWLEIIPKIEKLLGVKLERKDYSARDIELDAQHASDQAKKYSATLYEWNISGAAAIPRDVALKQREKFFRGVKFRDIEELITETQSCDVV